MCPSFTTSEMSSASTLVWASSSFLALSQKPANWSLLFLLCALSHFSAQQPQSPCSSSCEILIFGQPSFKVKIWKPPRSLMPQEHLHMCTQNVRRLHSFPSPDLLLPLLWSLTSSHTGLCWNLLQGPYICWLIALFTSFQIFPQNIPQGGFLLKLHPIT